MNDGGPRPAEATRSEPALAGTRPVSVALAAAPPDLVLRVKSAALDAALHGFALADADGTLTDVNHAFLDIFRYADAAEVIGRSGLSMLADPALGAEILGVVLAGGCWRGEAEGRRADGDVVVLELSASAFLDADGHVTALMVSFTDITQRKATEKALRQSEQRMRTIVESEPECVKIVDAGCRLLGMNPAGFAMVGADSLDVVRGACLLDLVAPEYRDAYRDGVAAVFRGETTLLEFEIVGLDGRRRWMEQRAAPLRDPERPDQVVEMLAVSRDITVQKRTEATIRASLHEKDVLLREIHHRVKNNLQVISSLLYFHAKRTTDPQARGVFHDARERLRSMSLVHEKLYNSPDLAHVDFRDYVVALVREIGEASAAGQGAVAFSVEASPLLLPIDKALPAGMILVELITNVQKHAFPGGQGGRAVVRLDQTDGTTRLVVHDDGVGLPDDFDTSTTDSFGWRLVRSLAEQLDGAYAVEGRGGTRVAVAFPSEPRSGTGAVLNRG